MAELNAHHWEKSELNFCPLYFLLHTMMLLVLCLLIIPKFVLSLPGKWTGHKKEVTSKALRNLISKLLLSPIQKIGI